MPLLREFVASLAGRARQFRGGTRLSASGSFARLDVRPAPQTQPVDGERARHRPRRLFRRPPALVVHRADDFARVRAQRVFAMTRVATLSHVSAKCFRFEASASQLTIFCRAGRRVPQRENPQFFFFAQAVFYIPTRILSLDAPQVTQASERGGVERIVLLHPSELKK